MNGTGSAVTVNNSLIQNGSFLYMTGTGSGQVTLNGVVGTDGFVQGFQVAATTQGNYTSVLANGGNSYSGGTYVLNGMLGLGAVNALPVGRDVTVAAGTPRIWSRSVAGSGRCSTVPASRRTRSALR